MAKLKNQAGRHPLLAAALGFTVLAAIFFAGIITRDLIFRDAWHEFFVLNELWNWARAGSFPAWNPHISLGAPLVGAVYPGMFYPLHLLLDWALPIDAAWASRTYVFVHYPLALFGSFYLSRELGARDTAAAAGALAYGLGGYVVSQHYAANLLPGMALLPLALGLALGGAAKHRRAIGAGAVTGLIILGGDPQGFMLALGLSALLIALPIRKDDPSRPAARAMALGLFILCALLVGAAEIIPALTVLGQSARSGGLPLADGQCWSFNPRRLIEFLLVRPFGEPWPHPRYWGEFLSDRCFPLPLCLSPYLGVWAVAAAGYALVKARRDRAVIFMGLLLLGSLVMAFGSYTPVFALVFEHVPGVSALRYPEKHLLTASLALAVLAALGTERLFERPPAGRWLFIATAAGAITAPLVLLAGWLGRFALGRWLAPLVVQSASGVALDAAALDLVFSAVRLLTGLTVCFAVMALMSSKRRGLAAPALLLFIFVDLMSANRVLVPRAVGLWSQPSVFAQAIIAREQGATYDAALEAGRLPAPSALDPRYLDRIALGRFRISRDNLIPAPDPIDIEAVRRWERDTLKANLGIIEGFEYLAGMNVAQSRRFDFMTGQVLYFEDFPIFNVKYAVVRASMLDRLDPGVEVVKVHQGAALVALPGFLPRAYWIGGCREISEPDLPEAFAGNDFHRTVLVEGPGACADLPAPGDGVTPARVEVYQPDLVRLTVTAPREGLLVLNDAYFPGWSAAVDGAATPILRANGLVRAVRVSAGRHEVVFTYR